jgi:hypothetical protein
MLLGYTLLVEFLPQPQSRMVLTRVLLQRTYSVEMQPVLLGLPIQPRRQTCRVESLHSVTGWVSPRIGGSDKQNGQKESCDAQLWSYGLRA